jgi:DNA modification methylase
MLHNPNVTAHNGSLPIDHMACKDNLAFMAGLPTESMQLIVTSPPYNIGKSYERPYVANSNNNNVNVIR